MKRNASKKGGRKIFKSGMVRQETEGKGRFDLISPHALKRLAQTCEDGARKYNDRNWEKGCPFSDCLNHVFIHLNDYLSGKQDEDHLAHALWNIHALIHFEETKPWLNDLPWYEKEGKWKKKQEK